MSPGESNFLYEPRKALLSHMEQQFWAALKQGVPANYYVFPQINLASFIEKTDDSRYRNELFRNVDFLITDEQFAPKIVVEINDQTHLDKDRRTRDEKVLNILEEAGIPLLKLWTSYGVNEEYIRKKINETLDTPPVRSHHFNQANTQAENPQSPSPTNEPAPENSPVQNEKKGGCYVATCVYGSYDCPQVWTLRRYRDDTLAATRYGRAFIRIYYALSPKVVKCFGKAEWFTAMWKPKLDRLIERLNRNGVKNTPYEDRAW